MGKLACWRAQADTLCSGSPDSAQLLFTRASINLYRIELKQQSALSIQYIIIHGAAHELHQDMRNPATGHGSS
jgi:hypothetical protein